MRAKMKCCANCHFVESRVSYDDTRKPYPREIGTNFYCKHHMLYDRVTGGVFCLCSDVVKRCDELNLFEVRLAVEDQEKISYY